MWVRVFCKPLFFWRLLLKPGMLPAIESEGFMKRIVVASMLLFTAGPALADSIGAARAKPPEFTAEVALNAFDVERCIIDADTIGKPWIYRQPDRPNEVMIVWESSDLGAATVLEMRGLNPIQMKFWGRNKAWRKVQPCIGRSESDVT